MSERRESMIERVLHRIEEHVEEWRRQDAARKREAASHREELWAEAAERQKLLAENKLIGPNDAMNAQTLPKVKMPNADNFIIRFPDKI